MAMEARLTLRQTQRLVMTPMLQQAIQLLQLSTIELQELLQKELTENPMLEESPTEEGPAPEPPADQPAAEVTPPDAPAVAETVEAPELPFDITEIMFGPPEERTLVQQEEHEETRFENFVGTTTSLADHLYDQLRLSVAEPEVQKAGEEIIGNLDEDGYLRATLAEMAEKTSLPLGTFEAALALVQTFDPPGVAARDLRECLLIQLGEQADTESLTYRLVHDAFPDLIAHRWNDLAKRFGVEPVAVQAAADELARLDPKPGLKHASASDGYIIPDLIVDKIGTRYQVFLNDTGMPRLRLSRSYQEIARDKKKMTPENREFIASKMNSANWMIQAIEQRRQTMLKVMNFIVDRQRDFFEKGIEFLRPLTLREVAEVINMHESTVSRVTNEKYVQTPRGVLPLKFFFSSALATASGEDASARSIRAKLQKMVGDEDSAKPLTDQQIVHLFQEQGIQIARRTVAKYRDQLGILPARMRKRV
jgi:RNA polymerase sigma-54 factor